MEHFVLLLAAFVADVVPDVPKDSSGTLLVISAPLLAVLVGALIPILNGLLTKARTSPGVKGLLTLVLSLVSSLVTTATLENGTAVFSAQMVNTWVLTFVIAVASYAGVWRPLNLTSSPHLDPVSGNEVEGKLASGGVI